MRQVLSFNGNRRAGTTPELWDGKAANRIVEILHSIDNEAI